MAGINKWKTRKHFEVLISCTENKTKKPTQKQKGVDALQPPACLWWASGFSSSWGCQSSRQPLENNQVLFQFPHNVVKEERRIRQNCANPTLEPALRRGFLWDTAMANTSLRVLIPATGLRDGKYKHVLGPVGAMLQQSHCFMQNGVQGKWDNMKETFEVSLKEARELYMAINFQ